MVNQPKRIEMASDSVGVTGQTDVSFGPGTGTILRRLTNYHNIWWSIAVEPENADANANGVWVLWFKADDSQTNTVWSQSNIDTNDFTMQVIACGTWAASNQTPYTYVSQLKSSRNIVANQKLVLSVNRHGVSAGNVRVVSMLCASVAVK